MLRRFRPSRRLAATTATPTNAPTTTGLLTLAVEGFGTELRELVLATVSKALGDMIGFVEVHRRRTHRIDR